MLGIAAVLRFWALGRPDSLVFDELYYVRDAISQLAHGFPTVWPDDDPAFRDPAAFTAEASYAVHPPLGKWLIGLGVLLFGPDNGWGWRSAVALAGVATVGITMRLGWLMSRSMLVACTAGLLLAIDGVHIVLTRVALLDGFLALAVTLGALCVWRDQEGLRSISPARQPVLARQPVGNGDSEPAELPAPAELPVPADALAITWNRPWLLAAGVTFGAAASIKWSGLYPLAFFLIFIAVRDLILRRRELRWPGALRQSLAQALITAVITLPTALATYLASWAGWIASPDAWGRESDVPWIASLWEYHADMLAWHSTLSAAHPYQAHPITWPLGLRPTAMYEEGEGVISGISPLPNLLVTWGGVAALCMLAWLVLHEMVADRRLRIAAPEFVASGPVESHPLMFASAFVLTGYLAGWLPWLLTVSRSAVFQFYAVVLTPFSALALALVIGMLWGIPSGSQGTLRPGFHLSRDPEALLSRRLTVAIFMVFAVVIAVLFFPVWSGMPVAEWFWRAHMWLPGWS
ncbi:phospholipid carrier-dependent glycosyltransferase [Leucobacter insecticola]|uniref:Polyprenol-phosphate-mannose--protein mannosyltransferase n=1 Tax=Leucobacter insecticola TaxID=2714934 RepID=A0A6G8FLV8_9MICO|nr:phospholipid carrier-dependent glycosyltransferase [Leucobacter insecticola]